MKQFKPVDNLSGKEREKKKISKSGRRKLIVSGIAAAAIVLVIISAGSGYRLHKNFGGNSLSFQALENSVRGEMKDQLKSTEDYLNRLNQNISDNQKKLDRVNTQLTGREDSLLRVETTQMKLAENASDVSMKVQEVDRKVDIQIRDIRDGLDALQKEIGRTREEIACILLSLEEERAEGKKEREQSGQEIDRIGQSIQNVNDALARMDTEMNQSHEDLRGVLRELIKNEENGQEELISLLREVESSMKLLLDTDMVQLSESFQNLTLDFQNRTDMLGRLVDGSFKNLNQSLAEQFNRLSAAAGEKEDSLKSFLDGWNERLMQELNQVFTSVSNGKKLLASALLTKGVTVAEDAAFTQIQDAILRIEQKLVIGVQEIPGTITYHYHYHTDAQGGNPHEESAREKGGCFTVPEYHVHSEQGGCYRTEYYHKHTKSCPSHPIWVDWEPSEPDGYWGVAYDCGNRPDNVSRRVLSCPKNSGSIDCYLPSCGLSDGQIIGAEIVYDRLAAEKSVLMNPVPPERYAPPETDRAEETESPPPRAPEEMIREMETAVTEEEDTEEEGTEEESTEEEKAGEEETETEQETKQEGCGAAEAETEPAGESESPPDEEPAKSVTETDTAEETGESTMTEETAEEKEKPAETEGEEYAGQNIQNDSGL